HRAAWAVLRIVGITCGLGSSGPGRRPDSLMERKRNSHAERERRVAYFQVRPHLLSARARGGYSLSAPFARPCDSRVPAESKLNRCPPGRLGSLPAASLPLLHSPLWGV